jgi:hypothetical protein
MPVQSSGPADGVVDGPVVGPVVGVVAVGVGVGGGVRVGVGVTAGVRPAVAAGLAVGPAGGVATGADPETLGAGVVVVVVGRVVTARHAFTWSRRLPTMAIASVRSRATIPSPTLPCQ